MREDFKFRINNILIDQILANPNLLLETINTTTKKELNDYLLDCLPNRDGGPSFSEIKIVDLSYNTETKKGKFRLGFIINRFYCCSEIEASNADYVDFNFYIENEILFAQANYFVWELNN